jgi:hypothetical protein
MWLVLWPNGQLSGLEQAQFDMLFASADED